MIVKSILRRRAPARHGIIYHKSNTIEKIIILVRSLLNKWSNQQTRSFNERMIERQQNSLQIPDEKPRSTVQAEKKFVQNKDLSSVLEKGRLGRIDEILGTRTYHHQTRLYEQRIDYDHVMILSELYKANKPVERSILDYENHTALTQRQKTLRRRILKNIHKKKTYPSGNSELLKFSDDPLNKNNELLIKFLTEEQLYTRTALGQLQLVIESVQDEKILEQINGEVIDQQFTGDQFLFNGYVYFCPISTDSLYRIEQQNFTRKLISSPEFFLQALTQDKGNIAEVITLTEIYETLRQYYYDVRVSELLGKIQNETNEYMFSHLHISPDGEGVFVVIDLLGSKKEYVGIYRKIKEKNKQKILLENVIFNFRPEVSLKNGGELYLVQRSQQGLYTEFCKIKFNQYSTSQQPIKVQQQSQQIKSKIHTQILYKCQVHREIRIQPSTRAQLCNKDTKIISDHILLEQTEIGTKNNNHFFLIQHRNGMNYNKNKLKMQLINSNNSQLQKLFQKYNINRKEGHTAQWITDPKRLYTQCHQILEVGFVLIRYQQIKEKEYLKFGHHSKYARYVTLVPYINAIQHLPNNPSFDQIEDKKQQQTAFIEDKNPKQNNQIQSIQETQGIYQIQLPSQQSSLLFNQELHPERYILSHSQQQLIYICPQSQFITNLTVKHISQSNIYLLMSLSVQSVYNRNSLYLHPLRKGIVPYSIYLDGHEIVIPNQNRDISKSGNIQLKVMSPILPINVEYTLWKKELHENVNHRIYTEDIKVKEDEDGNEIVIKLVSSTRFAKNKNKQDFQGQPIILFMPSRNERLDENTTKKILQKGVILVQIVKCRGIFGTNMLDVIRGSQNNHENYISDVLDTILFLKQRINERIGIIAEGAPACYSLLMLNVAYNQDGELFDASLLNNGIYNIKNIAHEDKYFFGENIDIFQNRNPINFTMFDPSKLSKQQGSQSDQQQFKDQVIIQKLSNMIFSSSKAQDRQHSRSFVNKIRCQDKAVYETVYMKQFESPSQKDIYGLSFLYMIMRNKMLQEATKFNKTKYQNIAQVGQAETVDEKAKQRKKQENQHL